MPAVRYDLDGDSSGLVSSLEDSIRALTATIDKSKNLEQQQQKTATATQRLVGVLRAGVGGITAVATAAIGAGTALASMASDAAEVVGEMNAFSTRTGLAVETLNGLRLAAQFAGRELEDVVPEDLSVRIFEAAQGTGDGAEAFEILGIQARKANGTLREADDVFRDIIDKLAQMEDRTLAAAMADQLFSDQGTALLGVLDEGSVELDRFTALAGEYGYRVGPEAQKVTKSWQEGVAGLKLALEDSLQTVIDWGAAVGVTGDNLKLGAAILVHWSSLLREGKSLVTDTEAALARADARAVEFWHSLRSGAEEGADATEGASRAADGLHKTIVKVKDEKLDKALSEAAREAERAARELWNLEQRSQSFWSSWASDARSAEMDKAFLPLEAALARARQGADEMLVAVDKMAEGVEEALDAAVERQRSIMGGFRALIDQTAEGAGLIFQMLAEDAAAERDRLSEWTDAAERRLEDLRKRAEDGDQRARDQIAGQRELVDDLRERERAAAREAFLREQAMRREQASMAIALAVLQAYAQLGPIGGTISAAGMAGLLGMQLQRIDSAKPPRHSGGPVDGMGADEGFLLGHLMRQGEQLRVISQRGAEMFEMLERGQGRGRRGDAPARLVLADAGRAIGEALVREAARPGSRLGSAGSVGAGDPYRRS